MKALAQTAAVGVAFYLAALLGLKVGLPGTSASPVWIAAGVSLAGCLLFGRHVLVGVFVAAVLAERTSSPLGLSLVFAAANVVEPLIAATALKRLAGPRSGLLHLRDVGVLLAFGAGAGAAAAATIGAAGLAWAYGLPAADFTVNWFTWWLGDVSGIILVTPLIVYAARLPWSWPGVSRVAQATGLVAATAAIGVIAFSGVVERAWALPAQSCIFLLIVWIAFTFGPRVSMLALDIVVVVTVLAAVEGRGPFMQLSLNSTLLSLQAAMCATGVAVLILATLVTQRREAIEALEANRDDLEAQVRRRTEELEHLASHDPLTGLLNRRGFEERLEQAASLARRGRPSALLYADLDGFKQYNDRFGHGAGDDALVAVAEAMHVEVRDTDAVARLGGDEFAVILDAAPEPAALETGRRISERVAALEPAPGGRITMSVGAIGIDGSRELDDIKAAVDRAMYGAKALPSNGGVLSAGEAEAGLADRPA